MKTKKLDSKELMFVEHYLLDPNPRKSALAAGYAETTAKTKAFSWVCESKCPENKRHVLDEIRKRQRERSEETKIDANWLLTRLAKIAEFNIRKFLVITDEGDAYYDFSSATDDDWYCIGEYTADQISKGSGDDRYEVDRVKVKQLDRMKAFELIGRHVDVKAFTDKIEVEVTDKSTILEEARKRAAGAKK